MSTQPNDGGPAFPRAASETDNPNMFHSPQDGMSLRDYFAAAALQGILSNHELLLNLDEMVPEKGTRHVAALSAYALADAMLAARGKEEA